MRAILAVALAALLGTACNHAPRKPLSAADIPGSYAKPLAFAVLEDWDKGTDLSEVSRDFALMRDLGITTWRGSFGWDDYEPSPGKYDFVWLKSFVELAQREGMALRPYIAYTPRWAGRRGRDRDAWNDPPRSLRSWRAFTSRLARELRDYPNLRSYEIYNEENVKQWWEGTADEYAQTLAVGARALREGDPDVEVLFGGMVYPDVKWLERVCRARSVKAATDVIPFHAYPETWTPDSVQLENYLGRYYGTSFVHAVRTNCKVWPIWINELGFATVPGKTEEQQANWWARAIATFGADPYVEQLGIYEIKDLSPDQPAIGDAPNYHLGLTRADRTPKLAFSTVQLLVRLLGRDSIIVADSALDVSVVAGNALDLNTHLFVRPDGQMLLFAWDRRGAPTLRLKVPLPARRAVEYELDGRGHGRAIRRNTLDQIRLRPGGIRIFSLRP